VLYLVDTNVLLRFADRTHQFYPKIRLAVRCLRIDQHKLVITSQNCVEFWNVATRPMNKNGFGLTPNDAHNLLKLIERLFPILPDRSDIYQEWRRLIVHFKVSGVQVHDARLVAAMKVYGIPNILTMNVDDFRRYSGEGIIAIDPLSLS
jgi:predicted nucleic acid-binding protein